MAKEKVVGQEDTPGAMQRLREFIKEARVEFWKVSWPTWPELRDSTVVVIVMVICVSVFIGLVDRVLTYGVSKLFG